MRREYNKTKLRRPHSMVGLSWKESGRGNPPPPEGARLVWDAAQGKMVFKLPVE